MGDFAGKFRSLLPLRTTTTSSMKRVPLFGVLLVLAFLCFLGTVSSRFEPHDATQYQIGSSVVIVCNVSSLRKKLTIGAL